MRIGLTGWQRETAATVGDAGDFLALMERADALGYDSVWFNELHFQRTGLLFSSPLLLAAAIFARTERMRAGTSVVVLPLHHPLLVAEQVAQLDWQSGGRIDVGIGRSAGGSDGAIYAHLGLDPGTLRQRFEEGYDAIVRAWTRERASFAGRHWRFESVEVGPPPVQQPHPPVYVAGYTRETIDFAVRRNLPLLLSLQPPETAQLALYRECIAERGLPYDASRFSLPRYVCIGRTNEEAGALVDDLLPRLHRRRLEVARRRGTPADQVKLPTREDFLREQAIAGDPEACLAQIEETVRRLGVGEIRCVFNGTGELDRARTLAGMELFAREVLPWCRRLAPAPCEAPMLAGAATPSTLAS